MSDTNRSAMRRELEASLEGDSGRDALLNLWEALPADDQPLTAEELASDRAFVQRALRHPPVQSRSMARIWAVAAAFSAAAALLVWMLMPGAPVEYIGAGATGSTITLPDGSSVVLSPGSRLQLKSEREDERVVMLSGEALFDVVKRPEPFVVETSNAVIRVLGTVFKVSSGSVVRTDSAAYTKVMLAEGAVQVQFPEIKLEEELAPGEESALIGTTHSRRQAGTRWLDDWKSGRLHFDQEPLEYVFSELQRQYGTSIEVDPAVDLTGRLSYYRRRPATADSVLMEIAALKELRISVKNNTFRISR